MQKRNKTQHIQNHEHIYNLCYIYNITNAHLHICGSQCDILVSRAHPCECCIRAAVSPRLCVVMLQPVERILLAGCKAVLEKQRVGFVTTHLISELKNLVGGRFLQLITEEKAALLLDFPTGQAIHEETDTSCACYCCKIYHCYISFQTTWNLGNQQHTNNTDSVSHNRNCFFYIRYLELITTFDIFDVG